MHNIIVGKLWIDNHGEMDIVNHTTGEKCHLIYKPYSYFSREVPRRVSCVESETEKSNFKNNPFPLWICCFPAVY